MMTFQVKSLTDYEAVFSSLNSKTVLLKGLMGAGKTTFVKEFLRFKYSLSDKELTRLGVMSPTFSIENHYKVKDQNIIHCDFYRVNKSNYETEELLESLEDFDWIFIEWAENLGLEDILKDRCTVEIQIDGDAQNCLRKVNLF